MRKIDIKYLEQVIEHYDIIYRKLNIVREHSYCDDDVIIAEGLDRREIPVPQLILDIIHNVRLDRDNVSRKVKYFKEYFKKELS